MHAAQERLASQLNNEVTRSGAVVVISMLAHAGLDISHVLGYLTVIHSQLNTGRTGLASRKSWT